MFMTFPRLLKFITFPGLQIRVLKLPVISRFFMNVGTLLNPTWTSSACLLWIKTPLKLNHELGRSRLDCTKLVWFYSNRLNLVSLLYIFMSFWMNGCFVSFWRNEDEGALLTLIIHGELLCVGVDGFDAVGLYADVSLHQSVLLQQILHSQQMLPVILRQQQHLRRTGDYITTSNLQLHRLD